MKWTKVRAGVYRSGKYELRQAYSRASKDGWMICTDDDSWHDSTRLLSGAKKRAETHAAQQAKITETAAKAEAKIPKVDLLNASPHQFCETLRLAASIGVTDAIASNAARSAHDLAALLCEREKYRYEHVNMLHEAYESGQMFMELRGQPTNMTWGTTTDSGWQETEHGRVRVRITEGKRP